MKNNTKYSITGDCVITAKDSEGKLHKIDIDREEFPMDPRRDWGDNIDHMIIDWDRYDLGDRKDCSVSDELTRLIRSACSEEEVIDAALGEKSKLGTIRLIKDEDPEAEEDDYLLQVWCEWRTAFNRGPAHWENECSVKKEYAFDYIIDVLTDAHCIKLLKPHMEILPISIYEHSGITMYVGAPNNDFDSGYAGFIYMTKEEVFENLAGVTEENWREVADEFMKGSVKTYAEFLEGNVYGYEVFYTVNYPAEIHHEIVTDAETGEIIRDRTWTTEASSEWEPYSDGWCGSFFGYNHEENGILDELPDDWEIVSVD